MLLNHFRPMFLFLYPLKMADTLWFFDVSLQCRKENGLIIYAKSKIGNKGNHAKENRKNTGKNK